MARKPRLEFPGAGYHVINRGNTGGICLGSPGRLGALRKVRVAALMRATTSVSNGWLAEKLKMGRPATVSQCVRRFRLEKGEQTVDYVQALSTVNS
jgi:hypothetical protein